MMVKYSKPMVIVDQGLAEGVYAASGTGCYTVTANIHQTPQTGSGDYRILVEGEQEAGQRRVAGVGLVVVPV